MTNHYHLIVETPRSNLSKIMHFINGSYTTSVNIKRKRTGHLFQGRYRAILVDKDNYLLELSRYVHLNPVRANMTSRPEDYLHSSYRSYVGGPPESIVCTETILSMSSAKGSDATRHFKSFVEGAVGKEVVNPLQKVYGGMILGGKLFIRDTLEIVKLDRAPGMDVSHRKAIGSAMCPGEIISACCEHFGVSREEMTRNRRSEARKACVYLIRKHTCASNREIGQFFGGLSYSAVTKIAASASKRLIGDEDFRRKIRGLELKHSLLKGWPRVSHFSMICLLGCGSGLVLISIPRLTHVCKGQITFFRHPLWLTCFFLFPLLVAVFIAASRFRFSLPFGSPKRLVVLITSRFRRDQRAAKIAPAKRA